MAISSSLSPAPRRLRAAHFIDFDYLEHVADGDAAYVVLMARLFCAHFPEEMFLLEVAAARADVVALRQGLMRLGTTCQMMGLPRLVQLAQHLAAALSPGQPLPAHAQAVLRRLRYGGTSAMNSLALRLDERYPQALERLLHTSESA
ncbi:hypothetical protein GCM10023185_10530 [Hymenobacter saemangeumensis]|uniref:Uncharacterized protein n=1 Tax=Hymenobacter saemangeumensis TaxID=1084522 RepID=A0ABP8I585_9BACT